MTASFSDDDFQRLQLQLLELRENNYQLNEIKSRQDYEINQIRNKLIIQTKELDRANKAVSKSKKAQEVDLIYQENENLQRKFESQEEDFRLQNETLMRELNNLVGLNEKVENENLSLKNQIGEKHQTGDNDEIRRLNAQNAVLQKRNTDLQNLMQDDKQKLCSQILKSKEESSPVNELSCTNGENQPSSSITQPEEEISQNTDFVDHNSIEKNVNSEHESLDSSSHKLSDLNISLETEVEEKKMLKKQLEGQEELFKERLKKVEEENLKLNEKCKKKQDILTQVQAEKDNMYSNMKKQIDDVISVKDKQIHHLSEQCNLLNLELSKTNKNFDEHKQKAGHRLRELDHVIHDLRLQVDSATLESNQQLTEQNLQFRDNIEDLQMEIHEINQEKADLIYQVKEIKSNVELQRQQLNASQMEKDKLILSLQEINKTAEKRKCLLDELAIKYQKENDNHREHSRHYSEVIQNLKDSHQTEIQNLKDMNSNLKESLVNLKVDVETSKSECEKLKADKLKIDNAKTVIEDQLYSLQEELKCSKIEYEMLLEDSKMEHETSVNSLSEEYENDILSLKNQINDIQSDLQAKNDLITSLEQKIKDEIDYKKVHEKRGASQIKDLKRQLTSERKRSEKMQERLQEFLSDSRNGQTVEDLLQSVENTEKSHGDNSSTSSWSFLQSKESGYMQSSRQESESPCNLELENNDLLSRLTDLQKDKWQYEERIQHLEESNSAMAEDLLQKQSIVDHYCMDIKADGKSSVTEKMTLQRVMHFVKDNRDVNLRDMNKKLLKVLEETLTKNMHLQHDLETMSQELVRVSVATKSKRDDLTANS